MNKKLVSKYFSLIVAMELVIISVLVMAPRNYVSAAGSSNPTVIATIPLLGVVGGATASGVAVNPSTNLIYVANGYSNNVSVINGANNSVVATVSVGTIPDTVAVNPSTNLIYVANDESNNVSVINGANNSVVATVSVGTYPDAVAVNPSTNLIYVANFWSNNVSVINGANNSVVATVSVGTIPEDVAVNPSTNLIYVANGNSNNVSVINGATNSVVATVSVGTGPDAVAVNPSTNLIYVANGSNSNVSVINGTNNSVVATVSVGTGPDAVAVNPSTNLIYVANDESNNVSVINGATNSVVATVSVGTGPDAVAVNPSTNLIYVANGSNSNVSVINGTNNSVVATVSVGTGPDAVAVNPSTNLIYVANFNSNNVSVINGATNSVVAPVSVGTEPYAVAVNPSTNLIYVANGDSYNVSVINGTNNSVVATVSVGNTRPIGIAVNPSTNLIYVANGNSNNVSVINGANNSVVATVSVGTYPDTVAVNSSTNLIYVANFDSNNVSVINGANNSVVATVSVGTEPNAVAVNPSTNLIYVANGNSNNVSVINGANNSVVATVSVGTYPEAVAVNPSTNLIYVANDESNNVSVINGANNSVVATVSVGTYPEAVAVNPSTNLIYVANNLYSTVSVIQDGPSTSLPSLTSLIPNWGFQGQTLTGVVISGTNLSGATSITFSGAGVTASNLVANSAGTQITANIMVDSSATIGTRDVSVTTSAGTSTALVGGFTVTSLSYSPVPFGYNFSNPGVLQDGSLDNNITDMTTFTNTFDFTGVDLATKLQWFSFMQAKHIFGPGGNCFGMAASSLMENVYPSKDQFLENQNKNYLWELPYPNLIYNPNFKEYELNANGDIAGTLVEHLISYQMMQFAFPNILFKTEGTDAVLSTLRSKFPTEKYVLSITGLYNGRMEGHSLAPFLIKTVSADQEYDVFVYDPNHPGEYNHAIIFQKTNGLWNWTYDLGFDAVNNKEINWSGWSLPGGLLDQSIDLIPISAIYNGGSPLKLPTIVAGIIFLKGNANMSLHDQFGNTTEFANGSLTENIPNVQAVVSDGFIPGAIQEPWDPTFSISGDLNLKYQIESTSAGNEDYSLTKMGNGYFVEVDSKVGQQPCNITINNDGSTVSIAGESSDYNLVLHKSIDNTDGLTFQATQIPASASSTCQFSVDWNALAQGKQGVTVQLDTNGDGVFEKSFTSGSQLSAAEYISQTQAASGDATLSNLAISSGTLTPAFTSGTTGYTDSVGNTVSSVTVTPTVNQTNATVTINGTPVTSGTPSGAISLAVGPNTINVAVTAQDTTTVKIYSIVATRAAPLSSDATLSNLAVSSGTLTPAFTSGTTGYTDSVGNAVNSITVTPTVNQANATVTINGTPVTNGTPSGAISLAVGPNTINVAVTAQDTTTVKTYSIVVTRAAPSSSDATLSNLAISSGTLTPAFTSGTTGYTDSVGNAVNSITVTPTVNQANATVTINGTPVTNGTPSGAISLAVGPNTINVAVTAQDTTTVKTYSIVVTRAAPSSSDATLSNLAISSGTLTPAFTSGTTGYTDSVGNTVSSVIVTPTVNQANATVTINGTPVTNGTPSGAISLAVGPNTINVAVTAQDTTTVKTYSIVVTRAAPSSSDATLSNLAISSGTLTPAFTSGTTGYTDSVGNTVSSVTVTPTVNQANATVTINGTPVTSGTPSGAITLAVGSNTINVAVTTQDTTTVKTYSIVVTRATPPSESKPTRTFLGTYPNPSDYSKPVRLIVVVFGVGGNNTPEVFFHNGELDPDILTQRSRDNLSIPTGTVVFKDGPAIIGTVPLDKMGMAILNCSSLSVGKHSITAEYSGNTNYNSSTSSVVTQTVKYNTSTKITSSINPSTVGQLLTFTSTISSSSGIPTGTVTFKDWDTTIAKNIPLVGNKATFNTSSLPAGIHNISATYDGDDSFAGSSDNLNQMVKKASSIIKIISSLNPSNRSQSITFTTTVSAISPAIGIPTGRVIFEDGNTIIGEGIIDMAGVAKYSTSFLPKGMHNITATYIGDFNFNSSDSPGITQTVK